MSQTPDSRSFVDLAYDGFCSGAVGGSIVALFFLLVDAIDGNPLFTASLIGSVLFGGEAAEAVRGVHLDMVAYYSIVHFGVFGVLGFGAAALVDEVERRVSHPVWVVVALFAVFQLAFLGVAGLLVPGVIERLGVVTVAAANLMAASGMALVPLASRHPGLLRNLGQAFHRPA